MSTDAAILDAALEQLALTGVRRTSTDDIARRAGVNRATLYRRFGGRDELLASIYLHQARLFVDELERRVPPPPEPGSAEADGFDLEADVVAFFTHAISLARGNELLQRMLVVDREETLVGLTVDAGPVLQLCAEVLVARLAALRRLQGREPGDLADLAITIARLAQSLVLTPDAPPTLHSAGDHERYARAVIVPMVLGPLS